MNIVVWLRSLGLGKYEAAFRENDIDETILPGLTHETLKELGVASIGHRVKLLDAIAALPSDASGKTPSGDATTTSSTPSAHPEDRAERRQVTVMFSDLVGSTALSARMDPEDLREVISAYQKCVAETVRRFGGFVAKYMGDGVLIYFGYPQAHEDDAERAVRAGLELVAAVGALKSHAPLQTRVGVATGLVVVGDLIGSGASQEQAIVGETPNLAARLQGIAEPNSVVIAESTRKLLGNLFELEDLEPKDLKGIAGPVRAWVALRQASVEGRFEAFHASGLTELVGRQEELDLLFRRWSEAKTGEGQVVLLSGEAGIGKSRLTAALLERLVTVPHTRLRYFCSPQHTDSAFYPIIGQMERAAGLQRDDTSLAKLDKLDALLAQTSTSKEDVALLAEMLSLPNDGRYPSLDLTAQQRRQRTLEALTTQLERLAGRHPLLMIFEDLHWIDPTSLEAVRRSVDQIKALSALMIVTFRPEFVAPWVGQSQATSIILNRLGERDAAAIVASLAGKKNLPADVLAEIVERTDGIPLFVEEMTKAVVEAEGESDARKTTAAVPSSFVAVPASLHASLMARLDRLGPAKEVAQIGAVIGREFSHALLAAVVNEPEAKLLSMLERLTAAGLLLGQGVPPNATYLFKHALIQDAAYGTLLRGPRRALHARIAETLENQFADIAETQPELVARHCTEAGLIEKASGLWGKAGQRSLERSALVEATAQFERALRQIATLPATPALRREQISLQVALANTLMHTKGYAAPETKAAIGQARLLIEKAEILGEPPEDQLLVFSILYGFWVVNYVAFEGDTLRKLAAEFLARAEAQGANAPLMIGHRLMGTSEMLTGNATAARPHFDQALTLYDPVAHRQLATRFGQDIRVTILSYRSWALYALGFPEAALADCNQGIDAAREVGQAGTLMYSLGHGLFTYLHCGCYAKAEALNDELLTLADQKNVLYWKALGTVARGISMAFIEQWSEAARTLSTGISLLRSTGATLNMPMYLAPLAMALARMGQVEAAWPAIQEALTVIETSGEWWFEAEVSRTAGEVLLMGPAADAVKAQAHFERALAVAREQQAKSWELRASMSLARLWRDQGKVQQAREPLAPVYGWFSEGFDTRDLKEAKALLEELAT
jgi:class 3 adenylate cyclase/predicted ATPase